MFDLLFLLEALSSSVSRFGPSGVFYCVVLEVVTHGAYILHLMQRLLSHNQFYLCLWRKYILCSNVRAE